MRCVPRTRGTDSLHVRYCSGTRSAEELCGASHLGNAMFRALVFAIAIENRRGIHDRDWLGLWSCLSMECLAQLVFPAANLRAFSGKMATDESAATRFGVGLRRSADEFLPAEDSPEFEGVSSDRIIRG